GPLRWVPGPGCQAPAYGPALDRAAPFLPITVAAARSSRIACCPGGVRLANEPLAGVRAGQIPAPADFLRAVTPVPRSAPAWLAVITRGGNNRAGPLSAHADRGALGSRPSLKPCD